MQLSDELIELRRIADRRSDSSLEPVDPSERACLAAFRTEHGTLCSEYCSSDGRLAWRFG